MNKCLSCGVLLQSEDPSKPGYITSSDNKICQRCFDIKNYNKNSNSVLIDNDDLISRINEKNIFTFFLCDFISLDDEIINLYNNITNDKVFVLTKCDIIPKNLKFTNIINRIQKVYNIDNVIICSKKNLYNVNEIMSLIKKHQICIFSGPSNGGKSSLINVLFAEKLIESNFRNTTQDFIEIKKDNIIVYDAPGFNIESKGFLFKKTLDNKTIQLKKDYCIKVENYVISFSKDVNLTLFIPNEVNVTTFKKAEDLKEKNIISGYCDILINNLGFIYLNADCEVESNLSIKIRESIIGGK